MSPVLKRPDDITIFDRSAPAQNHPGEMVALFEVRPGDSDSEGRMFGSYDPAYRFAQDIAHRVGVSVWLEKQVGHDELVATFRNRQSEFETRQNDPG